MLRAHDRHRVPDRFCRPSTDRLPRGVARALRRGALAAFTVAALAGLRLVDALSAFSALVVIAVAVAAEWLASRRLDSP